MERPTGAELRSSPKANQNAGITIPYRVYQPLEGGNGVREANVVTLCSARGLCRSRKPFRVADEVRLILALPVSWYLVFPQVSPFTDLTD